jgi:ATP-dependent DNA helicase RecG
VKPEEFDFILKEGEGQFIEFKENLDKSLAKEMVAFANASGGKIFLGVTDKCEVKGINVTNELKAQILDLAHNCDPSISIKLEAFRNLLIIEVLESRNKPYSCSQGFYLRNGAQSPKMSRDEIIEFSISEGKIKFDEMINDEFDFEKDFDERKLEQYLKLSGLTKNLPTTEILLNLKVAKMIGRKLKLNNTGVLFFAKNPEKFFFVSKVVCVNYRNNEKVDILDRKIFDEGILSNILEAENYVTKHINVEFEIKSLKRKEIPQYPKAAYREAIVNAVMHRDYFEKSGDTLVEIFRNKIIVSNPGGLVKWLKEEDFGKYSRPRNPLIAELLSKTEYVEKLGTGINRIRLAMQELGLPEPIFEYNSSFATILLDKTKGKGEQEQSQETTQKTPQKTTQKIIELIQENPNITRKQLSEKIGITEDGIKYNLNILVKSGLIKRIGPDKGGHWEVK